MKFNTVFMRAHPIVPEVVGTYLINGNELDKLEISRLPGGAYGYFLDAPTSGWTGFGFFSPDRCFYSGVFRHTHNNDLLIGSTGVHIGVVNWDTGIIEVDGFTAGRGSFSAFWEQVEKDGEK